jgi:hypothetical protein
VRLVNPVTPSVLLSSPLPPSLSLSQPCPQFANRLKTDPSFAAWFQPLEESLVELLTSPCWGGEAVFPVHRWTRVLLLQQLLVEAFDLLGAARGGAGRGGAGRGGAWGGVWEGKGPLVRRQPKKRKRPVA